MKKKIVRQKVFAGVMALVMSAVSIVSVVGVVQAEDATVTDKPKIDLVFENEVGEKTLSQEDTEAIVEAFGYTQISDEFGVTICDENTSAKVDWEQSEIPYGEVYTTRVFTPILSRDENGKLMIRKDEYGEIERQHSGGGGWCVGIDGKIEEYAGCEDSYFDMHDMDSPYFDRTGRSINLHMGNNWFWEYDEEVKDYCKKTFNDVYVVRFYYTTDGLGNLFTSNIDTADRPRGWIDYWILPEASLSTTILHFEEEETDITPAETYTVELPADKSSISSSELEALIVENQTQDVVIKSNNDVTFTFKKGTMQAVEGKDSYDFSTTWNTNYTSDLPFYVTKNNFIAQVDYQYSGQLPAEASIRFYVGTQYAGKTLYYSLMKEDKSYAEVQTITVDNEGYMTVKQNHCSSYVITTEYPNAASSSENKNDTTKEQEQSNTTEQNQNTTTGTPTSNSAVIGNTNSGNSTTGNTNGNVTNSTTENSDNANSQISAPNLKKISNVKNGVKLQWERVSNAKGYYIYRKTGKGVYKLIDNVEDGSQTSYVDKTAKHQKTYSYQVKSYKESGKSEGSNAKTTCFIKGPSNIKIKETAFGVQFTYSKGKNISGCQVKYVEKSKKKKTYTCEWNGKDTKKVSFVLKNVSTKKGIKIRNYIKVGKKIYYSAWKNV